VRKRGSEEVRNGGREEGGRKGGRKEERIEQVFFLHIP